jgi:hypothetical protein
MFHLRGSEGGSIAARVRGSFQEERFAADPEQFDHQFLNSNQIDLCGSRPDYANQIDLCDGAHQTEFRVINTGAVSHRRHWG